MPVSINGNTGVITGLAVGGLPNGSVTAANLASGVRGIQMVDYWRVTSAVDAGSSSATFIESNWSRVDTDSYGGIGTGMTESSGFFTFPSTGVYLILAQFSFTNSSSAANCYGYISTTQDSGSNFSDASLVLTRIADPNNNASTNCNFVFDVTNTSTHGVKMKVYTNNSNTNLRGNTGRTESGFTFVKLGDT
tara:strand:- start:415 stop:990 length:576 start_codon:yes stop_codon:yes gene_type:complete